MLLQCVLSIRGMCLLMLVMVQATLMAQQNPDDKLKVDAKVKIGKLSNGLTYFIRQNKKPQNVVEMRLAINVGSVLEDETQQGLAHMSEHMAFNGTTHFKKNDIISYLQDIGIGFGNDLNAYTGFDETVYMLTVPTSKPGNLEKGFQVLEDWAHGVTYNTEDIEGERAIILEESRLGKGAQDRLEKKIFPGLLEGSVYARRLPIGIDSIIANFKPEEIRRFYKEWYRPDLMAVVIVGDIAPATAEAMIKKHFSSLKNPPSPRPRTKQELPPYKKSNAIVATDKEATDYTVSINYPAYIKPPTVTVKDYRNDIIESIFLSLANQRLQEVSQKENPPFVYAGVSTGSFAHGYDAFNFFAGTGNGDIMVGLDALVEEIERIKQYGFTSNELERARKNVYSFYERAYNNRDKTESANYVQEYVNYFLQSEPTPGIETEFELVKQFLPGITVKEVNDVAARFRDEKNRFVYVTGPDPKADEKLPEGKDLLAAIEAKESTAVKPYEEKTVSATLLKEEPRAGKVLSRILNSILGTTELKLSNGINVTLKPTNFKNDQIVVGATRAGGKNVFDLPDKYNAEYATTIITSMGVGEFSPVELRKTLAGKSVSVSPVMTPVAEGMRGSSSVKDLETFFQLNYLYFTTPRKDTSLFNSFIQKTKSQVALLGADPETSFLDTMYQVYYHNDPLSPVIVPKVKDFDKVSLDRVMTIYRERFTDAGGMNFVFVGSFDEARILPLIEKYIASLPVKNSNTMVVDNKLRPIEGQKTFYVNRGKEDKSLILSIYTGELPYDEALDLKLQALSEVLNIRIIEELREKIQGIYGGGTSGGLQKLPYSRYRFILQLPCGSAKADTLMKAVQKEFSDIVKNGPSQQNLDKVKKQWIEKYKTSIKENGTWLEQLLNYKLEGGDPRRFTNYEKFVSQLTPKDVQEAAKLVFEGKNKFTAVLMPENYKEKSAAIF